MPQGIQRGDEVTSNQPCESLTNLDRSEEESRNLTNVDQTTPVTPFISLPSQLT